jgi:hypothetical protein
LACYCWLSRCFSCYRYSGLKPRPSTGQVPFAHPRRLVAVVGDEPFDPLALLFASRVAASGVDGEAPGG